MAREGVFVSGVWLGQIIETGGAVHNVKWMLSLTSNTAYPSAFGVSALPSPVALHGSWDGDKAHLRLTETGGDTTCEYQGRVQQQEENGTYVFQGSLTRNGTRAQVVCMLDADSEASAAAATVLRVPAALLVSGLWLGQATPDESLSDFYLPTNPIRWSLAVQAARDAGAGVDGSVLGGGYFDDAADVPGRPLLFFTLTGSASPVEMASHVRVRITKTYERSAETDGYSVEYTGTLAAEDGFWWLRGTWRNEKACSFGNFACRRQSPGAFSALTCAVCHSAIGAGDMAAACTVCREPWTACARCTDSAGHAHPLERDTVFANEAAEGTCCAEVVADALARFAPRPFLGLRRAVAGKVSFEYLAYSDVAARAYDFTAALRESGVPPRSCCALIADLSPAYVAAMLGAVLHGATLVPLHGALAADTLAQVFRLTRPSVVVADAQYAACVDAALGACGDAAPSVRAVIMEPGLDHPQEEPPAEALSALLERGRATRGTGVPAPAQVNAEETTAVLFTSGSTGAPKGVIYTDEMVLPSKGTSNVQPFVRLDMQPFHPSFLISLLSVCACGGRRCIATDLGTVLDDVVAVRPTHISAPPVFWMMLRQEFFARLAAARARGGAAEDDGAIADSVRALLGNRLLEASSGGAPVPAAVIQFAREKLHLTLTDLYGSRETGGIARDGLVYASVDVVLLPVEGADYDPNGTPARGEIAVHSPRLSPGYYNDAARTREAFVEVGGKKYYRTGDVGEVVTVNGERRVRILDRCGFVVKMAQSEWVAPSKVEAVLESCPWIAQALVLAESGRTCPVAVVVPSALLRAAFDDIAATCSTKDETLFKCEERAAREVRFWCAHNHLRPIEVPQACAIENTPWNPENGALTSTFKKRRRELIARYRATCAALYARLELSPPLASAEPLTEEFRALLARVLPVARADVPGDATLVEIGGDSMAAARLAVLLRGAGVTVTALGVHQYTLRHLSTMLASASSGGIVPEGLREEMDWAAECHLPADVLPAPLRASGAALLTGATGFLGPCLLANILARTGPDTRVYALVRGRCVEDAAARLRADLERAGRPDLAIDERVVVLCADMTLPHMGLSDPVWSELRTNVADIYHSAARVNVALPYTALRSTNVGGTVSAIRLAAEAGARLHYVSSVSALPAGEQVPEDWLPLDVPSMTTRGGYALTKIVSEQLVRAAALRGVEARVFRLSSVCPDRRTGYTNTLDWSSLLLSAAATLGAAVPSDAHRLHWLPVDFVCDSIVALASDPSSVGGVFHLAGDGPTLAEAVAAMRAKGIAVERVADAEWQRRVKSGLPEGHPALPLQDALAAVDFRAAETLHVSVDATRAALSRLGITWPDVGCDDVARAVDFLRGAGLMPPVKGGPV